MLKPRSWERRLRLGIGSRLRPRRRSRTLLVEWLEDRMLLCGNGSLDAALGIAPNDAIVEDAHADEPVGYFKVTLPESGRLTILTQVEHISDANEEKNHQEPLDTRTSLLGPLGDLLIESEGQSAADPSDLIVQHLLAGTYFIKVEGVGGGSGDYTVTTTFEPAVPPNQPLLVDYLSDYPYAVAVPYQIAGDFNGDGAVDLATANAYTNDVSILLGLGDGTFQRTLNTVTGSFPIGIAAGDFNRDGRLDLATGNQGSSDISILIGQGDGTFVEAAERYAIGELGFSGLSVADLNGDDRLDLIAPNSRSGDVSILLGRGDGTFQIQRRYAVGELPFFAVPGDFTGDGRLDLAVGNYNSRDLSLLAGNGDGTFQEQERLPFGRGANQIAAADFNNDGRLDLASANIEGDVSIFLNQDGGRFIVAIQPAGGRAANSLTTGDFNGDGHADVATANRDSNDVSVLLGRGDGTFQAAVRYGVGNQSSSILSEDFNGDGNPDLAAVNIRSHDFSILLGLGDGTFQADLSGGHHSETNPQGALVGDFNGDGYQDLATVTFTGGDVLVFFGRGDGTFQNRTRYAVGATAVQLLSADFNEDGHADLATTNCDSQSFSILLGQADGTFRRQSAVPLPLRNSGEFVVVGDFNGDGHADLAGASQFTNGASVLLGNGDGSFRDALPFAVGDSPAGGAIGDFDGDGRLDVAFTNFFSTEHGLSVYLGNGDGTFRDPLRFDVGEEPYGLVTGDFNGDGRLDLANTNYGEQTVSVLLGRGDGTFADESRFATEGLPESILTVDFNRDGRLDLAVTSDLSNKLSVLLGRGDGTFEEQALFRVGDGPSPRRGLGAGDFNGDGRLDLAVPQVQSNDVAILLGSGDGRFAEPLPFPVGLGPAALVTGDFSNDGRLDVASVNPTTNMLAVSLGHGDTTLQAAITFAVGLAPVAVLRDDFNRDGRLDLVTANQGSGDISLLLGLGSGDFRDQLRFAAGANPVALASGDFNGDGRLDLAVASATTTNNVAVLLGDRSRTFLDPQIATAGDAPQALVAADFNRDGRLDLAVANYRSRDVTLLLGRGDGTFAEPIQLAAGAGPVALLAGDFNADGLLDFATANFRSNDVSVFLGKGGGQFQSAIGYATGIGPVSLTAGDFNGDGRLDLATANSRSDDMTLLLGRGDGIFTAPLRVEAADYPAGLASGDFNGDGRLDLALAAQLDTEIAIFPGTGDATFLPPGTLSTPVSAVPLVIDWNGDGASDVLVVDRGGEILLRLGRPGSPGVFEAPLVVNQGAPPARDLAVVRAGNSILLVALDAFTSALSFYAPGADGAFERTAGPVVPGNLTVRLAAGDVNGDARDDLVVVASGSAEVFVYLQNAGTGGLASALFPSIPHYRLPVGMLPSDVALADVDGDRRLDIVVTNATSGDVSVLRNDPNRPFDEQCRFRTGAGVYYIAQADGRLGREGALVVRSGEKPARILAGNFDGDANVELIVSNSGTNSLAILDATMSGGLMNPRSIHAGLKPTVMAAGRFNADPYLDLVVLNDGSSDVSIFLGDSRGGFQSQDRLNAGNAPTGIAANDVTGDGILDLLVGNEFGDILILPGNGDGTFQPYQRLGRKIALAVADLDGDGRDDFVFGNEALDRVTVQYALPHSTEVGPGSGVATQQIVGTRSDGLLAPGAVGTADLNRDGRLDLVIANSGANNVLVYLGTGAGEFALARSYFAGTNPTGIAIQDLNGDGRLDVVVANEGSNDVTVMLGQGDGNNWSLSPGPRLRAGAAPVATAVVDATGDGIQDLIVSNSQSNNLYLLPGVGGGFFNDQSPLVFPAGNSPVGAFVGNFDASPGLDLVSINAGSNDLTFFSGFLASSAAFTLSSGGVHPAAAVAGDFNHDGLDDLLVAHQGNGAIALLLGHEDGLRLGGLQSLGGNAHPTALALAETDPGAMSFYVAGEGAESARRLAFAFEFGPVPLPASVSRQYGESSRGQIADVLPLENATVAVVAALVTVRLDREFVAGDSGFDLLAYAGLAADDPALGCDANSPRRGAIDLGDDAQERSALLGWLTGNDDALARSRDLTREALLQSSAGPIPAEAQLTALRQLLAAWSPSADAPSAAAQVLLEMAQSAAAWLAERLESAPPAFTEPRLLPTPMPEQGAPTAEPQGVSETDGRTSTAPAALLATTLFALSCLRAERRVRGGKTPDDAPIMPRAHS